MKYNVSGCQLLSPEMEAGPEVGAKADLDKDIIRAITRRVTAGECGGLKMTASSLPFLPPRCTLSPLPLFRTGPNCFEKNLACVVV